MLHEKSLIAKIGAWDESLALCIPTDVDFLKRAFNAGARIVSSDELTVFKFNAASRRNAYLTRSAIEQEGILAHIRNGIDIRLPAMIDVIRSVVADKYIRIEAPKPGAPSEWYRHNARYKGTLKETVRLRSVEERIRFYLDDQLGGFEWHGPEPSEHWISARWSGPSLAATVEFPVSWEAGLSVLVHVVGHFQRNIADDVQLFANAERLEAKFESTPEGTILISAIVPPRCSGAEKVGESEPLRLTFRVARTQRPLDLGINQDRRWLGIAVNWVEVAPLASDDAEAVDVPSPS
jgi:hypothetical protein